jgi:hypothetical protein
MLRILATKSLRACCLLVIVRMFCLFFWIQCWKQCFKKKKRFWYKQDASVILLGNFLGKLMMKSELSFIQADSYNRHKLSLPVCCTISIVHCCHMFRPQEMTIFRELQTSHMHTAHIPNLFFLWLDSHSGPRTPLWGSIQVDTLHSIVLPWMGDRPIYLTIHKAHMRQPSITLAEFEPTIPASEQL